MKKRRRTDRDANGRRANRRSFDDREDIAFTHEEEFVFAEFEIFARVREEEDAIAFLNCEFAARAVVKNAPVADGNDYSARRLVFSRFGKIKPAGRALFRFVATNDDATTLGRRLVRDVKSFSDSCPQTDDQCLVVFRRSISDVS